MNNNIYNIIYSKLRQWLTPYFLANPKMNAWLAIIIQPVTFIYNDLLNFRTQKLYQLSITPQVTYLQKLLNDRYDYTLRRIRIVDAIDKPPVYLFVRSELKPRGFFTRAENNPVYFFARSESGSITNDFVIKIPYSVPFNELELKSLVNAYKLASKKFSIQLIN